ncbi:MAG: hypothetical protein KC503_09765 [Myxococcales bacterium]|nr:hypothetical protein [Myxococcales bacterium]
MSKHAIGRAAIVGAASLSLLVLSAAGCGSSLSYTIDKKQLREASRRGQLWVYDAENEIVVALDRLDEAKDELHTVRLRIKKAERTIRRAEKGGKGSAVRVAEAWLVHLESLEDWAKLNVRLHRFGLRVARAAVELAKAQVIQREDLLGGKNFNVKDFKVQYDELKKRFDRARKRVRKMRRDARKKEQRWWTLRRRYVAQTGDYNTGLWID